MDTPVGFDELLRLVEDDPSDLNPSESNIGYNSDIFGFDFSGLNFELFGGLNPLLQTPTESQDCDFVPSANLTQLVPKDVAGAAVVVKLDQNFARQMEVFITVSGFCSSIYCCTNI